jgi:hypothetical protein
MAAFDGPIRSRVWQRLRDRRSDSLYGDGVTFTLNPASKPRSDSYLHVLDRWKCNLAVNFVDW